MIRIILPMSISEFSEFLALSKISLSIMKIFFCILLSKFSLNLMKECAFLYLSQDWKYFLLSVNFLLLSSEFSFLYGFHDCQHFLSNIVFRIALSNISLSIMKIFFCMLLSGLSKFSLNLIKECSFLYLFQDCKYFLLWTFHLSIKIFII